MWRFWLRTNAESCEHKLTLLATFLYCPLGRFRPDFIGLMLTHELCRRSSVEYLKRRYSMSRNGVLAGLVGLAIFAMAGPLRAGDAEVGALNSKLIAQGVLLSSANSTQLANAVLAVLNDPAFSKLEIRDHHG